MGRAYSTAWNKTLALVDNCGNGYSREAEAVDYYSDLTVESDMNENEIMSWSALLTMTWSVMASLSLNRHLNPPKSDQI